MTAWRMELGLSVATLALSLVAVYRWGGMQHQPPQAATGDEPGVDAAVPVPRKSTKRRESLDG